MRRITERRPRIHTLDIALPDLSARAVVVRGTDRALVWDTLTCPADMAEIEPLLDSLPFYVVYSHADWDHVHGTAGFGRHPIFVIGHHECQRRFQHEAKQTLADMQMTEPGKWDDVRLVPPNLTFDRWLSLDLGDLMVELHHLPGHTRDGIVAWLPDHGVLLSGDATETPLPVINDASLLTDWLQALEGWSCSDELELVIPTHGSAAGAESLDVTTDYLRRVISGDAVDLPPDLDEFYRRTHAQNRRLARQLQEND